ncbi:MAG: hypothetical protein HY028_08740 [Gammaproteobacteria bacterium]|nr:hypothetical protein [Gammaproteobacteria bacterium]
MKMLNKKLVRDLWRMKSQAVTIALVVAAGIAGFIGSLSTYDSLRWSRENYYDTARFADVFAELKRAPRAVERRIAELPGVADAETTVQFDVTLDIPGVAEPVVGRMIGLADGGQPRLNRLFIRHGRLPETGRPHEAVVSEGFAAKRQIKPGDRLAALINGKRETIEIVGIGLSPEYIFATRGGAFPDDRGFGVFWMDRVHLASAFTKVSALGVEEQRVNVVMDIASPREQWLTLGDGYKVDTRIVIFSAENVLKVPVSALFCEGDNWAVFMARDGYAQKRTVQIAKRNGLEALVEKGLDMGMQVIVYPGDAVHDGVRIKAR